MGAQIHQLAANVWAVYLHDWDCSIERKAGGWGDACDAAAQHFHCTSNSSPMSMIAEVVRRVFGGGRQAICSN